VSIEENGVDPLASRVSKRVNRIENEQGSSGTMKDILGPGSELRGSTCPYPLWNLPIFQIDTCHVLLSYVLKKANICN